MLHVLTWRKLALQFLRVIIRFKIHKSPDAPQYPTQFKAVKRTHDSYLFGFGHKNGHAIFKKQDIYASKNVANSLILNDYIGAGDEIRTHDIYLGKVTPIIGEYLRISQKPTKYG